MLGAAVPSSTNVWILDGVWLKDKENAGRIPEYDFEAIARGVQILTEQEAQWRALFAQRRISPLIVAYEDLVERHGSVVGDCLRFLHASSPTQLFPPGSRARASPLPMSGYRGSLTRVGEFGRSGQAELRGSSRSWARLSGRAQHRIPAMDGASIWGGEDPPSGE